MTQKVEYGCATIIRYVMKTHTPDGETKERAEEEFEFIFGVDRQIPTLEKVLENAVVNQRFSLFIPPSELYGEHDPSLIREIPRKGLVKQRLKQGKFYRQMKQGCLVSFKILKLKGDTVLADFNRPLSGIAVSMEGEVLAIREASEDEIQAAHEAQIRKTIGCG